MSDTEIVESKKRGRPSGDNKVEEIRTFLSLLYICGCNWSFTHCLLVRQLQRSVRGQQHRRLHRKKKIRAQQVRLKIRRPRNVAAVDQRVRSRKTEPSEAIIRNQRRRRQKVVVDHQKPKKTNPPKRTSQKAMILTTKTKIMKPIRMSRERMVIRERFQQFHKFLYIPFWKTQKKKKLFLSSMCKMYSEINWAQRNKNRTKGRSIGFDGNVNWLANHIIHKCNLFRWMFWTVRLILSY